MHTKAGSADLEEAENLSSKCVLAFCFNLFLMYVYIYVCMFIYIYIYIYICICIYIYKKMLTRDDAQLCSFAGTRGVCGKCVPN